MNSDFNLTKKNQTVSIFPISDVHVGTPLFNQEYYEYMLRKFDTTSGHKIIYLLGDLMDCATKRLGQSAYEQVLSPEEQLDYIVKSLKPYKKHIKAAVIGNHECFDEDTELLTDHGWVNYHQIDENTLVGTFNQDTRELEYQYPTNINFEYVEEDLIHLQSRSIDTLTTKNHRFLYTSNSDEKVLNNMRMDEIQNIDFTEIVLRQACQNNNDDYPINDDEIRLLAWCLTDSHFTKNQIIFYQRLSQVNRITDLLSRLNICYDYRERDRDIKEICGKKLKKKPEVNCEVTIRKEYLNELCYSHDSIPHYVREFSKRQFLIFLEELVFCDGSKHKSSPDNSWMLYKSKEFLDQIQILCIQNDIRTSLTEYRQGQYRLNISVNYNKSRIKNHQEVVPYQGIIWCVEVPNDTLIVRRNGKVVITGNSRFRKEFDLDIMSILCDQLGITYTTEIYDTLLINDKPYVVWGNHGIKTSQQLHLMQGQVQRQTSHIEANLYLYGHAHYLNSWSLVHKDGDTYKRRHYVLTGHYLNYEGSYAQEKMLKPSLPGFSKISVDSNHRTMVDLYNYDEITL